MSKTNLKNISKSTTDTKMIFEISELSKNV